MSGVLKKACWLLPVLFVVSPVLAQQGGGIQSAANIESHISFMSVFRGKVTHLQYPASLDFLHI